MNSPKTLHLSIRLVLIFSLLMACGRPATPTAIPPTPLTPKPPPVTPAPTNHLPTAMNSDLYVQQESSASLDLKSLASDPDEGDILTFSVKTPPGHGTASLTANTLKFTPTAEYLGLDQLAYQVSDGKGGIAQATLNITVSIAPPLDSSEVTDFASATDFLYTGSDPIQTGVDTGTIEDQRVAVLRGNVSDSSSKPLVGVKITVLDHPEYGETLTREGGVFDIAVNGGGWLTLNYVANAYLPVQRQIEAPWRDYAQLPEVILTPEGNNAASIDLSAITPMQVAQGNMITDSDGTRRETLFFPQGTTAHLAFADGTTQPVTKLTVHITEYTVGPDGEKAMPGELPSNSAYTYATEYSAEEAIKAGAESVVFDPPIISYNENFLNFPIGSSIPMGAYDRERGVWVASDNGLVIKVLSITLGKADLDIKGNSLPATPTELSGLGITDAERTKLAQLYSAGQSLWRTPVQHFTEPWDKNQGTSCKEPCPPPDNLKSEVVVVEPDCQGGSIIGCQNQTLGEIVELTGTPFYLRYQSDRMPGYNTASRLKIQLSGPNVSPTLKYIYVEVIVGGQITTERFDGAPNLSYTYIWNGRDGYGRILQGRQPVIVRLTYEYPLVYQATDKFGYNGQGQLDISTSPARGQFLLTKQWNAAIGDWKAPVQVLGGWGLNVHHQYDPGGKALNLGDGSQRSAESLNFDIMTTVAGNGSNSLFYSGDGGPATEATLSNPDSITVAPDGTLYFTDTGNNLIHRVGTDGIITTVAGNGATAFNGDGGPATQATLHQPEDIAIGPDGSLYIADLQHNRIRRVGPDGIITTVAGNGSGTYSGDGGLATQAALWGPTGIALSQDGSLYIADLTNNRIRKVGTDGIISTVAGNGGNSDGGLETQACLNRPYGIDVGSDGSLFIASAANNRICRIGPDGTITLVAGNGSNGYSGDGGSATLAALNFPRSIALSPDGSLYIADSNNHSIRRVGTDGTIITVAGGIRGFGGDNGPATKAKLESPYGIAVSPDGSLYIGDRANNRLRWVAPAFSGLSFNATYLASEDGSELYVFDSAGRHLRTLNALTGATLYEFSYDSAGRLWKVKDGDGNVTEIKRDPYGHLSSIVAPFGQTTKFTLDSNGYLKTATNPANETIQFAYTDNGLMTEMLDARHNTHNFQYDTLGRLIRDADPAGGFKTLTRTENGQSMSVVVDTALHRPTTYKIETLPNGDQRRINTFPDGHQSESLKKTDGTLISRSPDGTTQSITIGPDPRWGMLAPVTSQLTITTPDGLTYSAKETRTATLTDANNPFTLVTLTNTLTINGRLYTSIYTAATRTWVSRSPEGREVTTMIDEEGRIVFEQVKGLSPANYFYDDHGRLENATIGTGTEARIAKFSYNANSGYLESVTDPLNRKVSLSYDPAGRVTNQTLPDQRVISYTYDDNGNLDSLTPPGRPAHKFNYTPIDLPAHYTPPDVNSGTDETQYAYNADRQMTQLTRPDGQTIEVVYDSAGSLDTMTIARGILDYNYNPTTGNLASIDAPGNINLAYAFDGRLLVGQTWSGAITGTTTSTFDNDFRWKSTDVNGSSPIEFSYDDDGLLTKVGALILNDRDLQNGLLIRTTLDTITDSWHYNSFGEPDNYSVPSLFNVSYQRDKLGRIKTKTETIGGVTDVYGYMYDSAGRLWTVTKNGTALSTYIYDSNGNRLSGPGATGTYDNQDRMLTYGGASYAYTANGELRTKTVGNQTTTYQHDELGNLMKVTLPGGKVLEYLVDGQGRRIGKKVNGVLTQTLLYQDGLRPIAELDVTGNLTRFVYATRLNVPDYMTKGGVTYRFILDPLGSPRLIVNAVTGQVVQRIDYNEFGQVIEDSNPGFQPFGFAGGLYDPATGLIRFGARDYDAETGQWIARDPVGFEGGQTNLYAYVDNDPLNLLDPVGLRIVMVLPPYDQDYSVRASRWAADKSIDPNNAWYEDAFYTGIGILLSFFLPEVRGYTETAVTIGFCAVAGSPGGRFNPDQQALVQLAKDAQARGGVSPVEGATLVEWGKELGFGDAARGPEGPHPGSSLGPHIHVGPVNHILVK